jgi:glycosyltransferase involved in cell wall biosynthesis
MARGVRRSERVVRILQVHTRYRQAGGEDSVVEAERSLLSGAGLDVQQVIFDNADLRDAESLGGDVRLAAAAVWSRPSERRVRTALAASRAQVMHVHNTFSAASPSVYAAAASRGVPVVQTLHNYRLVCPSATAFRDGRPCTDCVGLPVPLPAVVHACVRGSRAQSAVTAITASVHRMRGTYRRDIAAYIALSEFQRALMIAGGLHAGRVSVIPNFLHPDPGTGAERRSGFLFAGRLTVEKGVPVLVEAAASVGNGVSLVGSGPLAATVESAASAGIVEYLGPQPREAVLEHVRRAIAVVVPSVWFEGLPLVLVEAFASATPVIASRIGSLAELVDDGVTGLLVDPNDPAALAERLGWAADHLHEMREMGSNARRRFEARYRADAHLEALRRLYDSVGSTQPTAMGRPT